MRSVLVAPGRIRYAGLWQLEIQPSERITDDKGEVIQPGGLRCVWLLSARSAGGPRAHGLRLLRPVPSHARLHPLPGKPANAGRAPGEPPPRPDQTGAGFRTDAGARQVRVVTVAGKVRMRSPVHEGPRGRDENYHVVGLPVHVGRGARINWLDSNDNAGSRGVQLLPPITE
jgi:hypothetical protein